MDELDCPYDVYVTVSIVDPDTIKNINNEFREIDAVTDVLSFPMSEYDEPGVFEGDIFDETMETDPDTDELLLGDVVLCYDRVISHAKEYGHSELREYSFLIVHSMLHLFGYDHMEDDERLVMEEKQREILDKAGILR
jgi:probable rRNA maturation factor